ncbi:MAG TPA: hypothetical protein VN805_09545 [Caulobacteraceae bacterium]|nr:hypothetical protein [Caulobacteraceae bacterium]
MADFDYAMLTLARGAPARQAFADRVRAAGLTGRGRRAGLFVAQLGWPAAEAALLAERGGDEDNAFRALLDAPEVVSSISHALKPTVRPLPDAVLAPGGIYVHRWLEVNRSLVAEFIDLSARAWPGFEAQFDARIFGLFELTSEWEGSPVDSRHLLLVTRYASHGVWEESRDPTAEAMQTFARRAQITLSTRAASALLIAP